MNFLPPLYTFFPPNPIHETRVIKIGKSSWNTSNFVERKKRKKKKKYENHFANLPAFENERNERKTLLDTSAASRRSIILIASKIARKRRRGSGGVARSTMNLNGKLDGWTGADSSKSQVRRRNQSSFARFGTDTRIPVENEPVADGPWDLFIAWKLRRRRVDRKNRG